MFTFVYFFIFEDATSLILLMFFSPCKVRIPDVSLKRKDTVSLVLARKAGCVFLDIRRQPDNEEGVAFRVTARSEAEMIVSQICIWLRG